MSKLTQTSNPVVNYILIASIFIVLFVSGGMVLGFLNTTQSDFFYQTINDTTRFPWFFAAAFCWLTTLVIAVVSVIRLFIDKKIDIKLYCHLITLMAFSWTTNTFAFEIAFKNHYAVNTDNSNILNGLLIVGICSVFVLLTQKAR